jgi:hypothetical protein
MLKSLVALALSLSIAVPALAACEQATFDTSGIAANVSVHLPTWAIAAADVNGDGRADLISGNGSSGLALSLSQPGHQLTTPVDLSTGTSGNVLDLETADLNADGFVDIISANGDNGTFTVLLGHGDATFTTLPYVATGAQTRAVHAADIDADGKLDLVMFSGQNMLVYRGAGDGTFEWLSSTPLTIPTALAIADFDGNGKLDVATGSYSPSAVVILFGIGNGTFTAQSAIPVDAFPSAFVAADLNGDAHPDLVVAGEDAHTISVLLNNGGGGFAAPVTYAVAGNPSDLAVGNFTNHGGNDIAVVSGNHGEVVIFRPAANGTLFSPSVISVGTPWRMDAADLDADGLPDIAVTVGQNKIGGRYNVCGKAYITAAPNQPLVSVGQPTSVNITLQRAGSSTAPFFGKLKVREGATVLYQQTRTWESTPTIGITTPVLAGEHLYTIEYSDDPNTDPLSTTCTQRVTTETTSTVGSLSTTTAEYGQEVTAHVTVTSSTGDTPGGTVYVLVSNGGTQKTIAAPQGDAVFTAPSPGAHDVTFYYFGDATHPPSEQTLQLTTTKATGHASLLVSTNTFIAGQSFTATGRVALGTGTVTLKDGQTPLATVPLSGTDAQFQPSLAPGVHTLRVEYSGDSNVQPATSDPVKVTVVSAQPLSLLVQGSADEVFLLWSEYPGAVQYRVSSGLPNQLVERARNGLTSYFDRFVTVGQPNLYRVEALGPNGNVLAASSDVGTRIAFTDELLDGTLIKAVHALELRDLLNTMRARVNLPPATLSLASGALVRAAELQTLRNALNDTRAAWGVSPVTFSEALSGAVVRAAQFDELRAAMR